MSFLLNPYRFAVADGGGDGGAAGTVFDAENTAATFTLSEGGVLVENTGGDADGLARAEPPNVWDAAHSAPRLYWEVEIVNAVHTQSMVGLVSDAENVETALVGDPGGGVWFFRSDGFIQRGGSVYKGAPDASMAWTTGDVVMFLLHGSKVFVGVNGTWFYFSGAYQETTTPPDGSQTTINLDTRNWLPFCAPRAAGGVHRLISEEADFTYALPTGYTALADYVPA